MSAAAPTRRIVVRLRRLGVFAAAGVLIAAGLVGWAYWRVHGRTLIEFRIYQNSEMIQFSDFGEPPQFAIWLEDPETDRLQTVFVTRRSATGDWEGKAECPAALPRWFEVYREETGKDGLPTPDAPAPDAVTGATPTAGQFACRIEVEPGSRWICWIEVNIAADFSEKHPQYNEQTGIEDTHMSGQPSLLYRGEVEAVVGAQITPAPYGQTLPDTLRGEMKASLDDITTARDIFTSVEIRVIRPPVKLF